MKESLLNLAFISYRKWPNTAGTEYFLLREDIYHRFVKDHSFSKYAKFSEKQKKIEKWKTNVSRAYHGLINVSFLENFTYVLNDWSITLQ